MTTLPYTFQDPRWLELALTHSSTSAEKDNERLEFLGDAVLDLIIAEELFRRHPDRAEGDLTEMKAWIVSRTVLAEAARAQALDDLVRVGSGMQNRALTRSVMANVYEAVLGAIYLDGGLEAARSYALDTLAGSLDSAQAEQPASNPKQALQHLAQQETGSPPTYVLLETRGHAHARAFRTAAVVADQRFPSAWGRTRKEAERWAAHEALLELEDESR